MELEIGGGGGGPGLVQPSIPFFLPNMSENEWRSSPEFSTAGMQLVYEAANCTLNLIFPTYDQYLGYASNYEEILNMTGSQWEGLIWENAGPLGYLVGVTAFILLLTLWGVGWIFSKCCCGDKGCCVRCLRSKDDLISAKLEQKRDKCKRNCCGVLFAALVVVFMFGLVCCFVTNEQMKMSVERMPDDVDNSLADVDTYLNTTQRQLNSLFIDNYELLGGTLNHILDESGNLIKDGLSKRTGAQTLDNLTEIVDTVEEVRRNVENVEKTSKNLKEKVERLKKGLSDRRTKILQLLDNCQSLKCAELKNMPEIRSLRVHNDFQNALAMYLPKLPNMTDVLRELGKLLSTDVRKSIEDGKAAFNELGRRIKEEVEPVLPSIRELIFSTGAELKDVARSLTSALQSIPVDAGRQKVRELEVVIKKYDPYRYYVVLGVCLTLSFIFTLLTLGIFVGFCGKQPGSDYSNECCSRKTGSSFLNCGIFFIFLTGGVLMVVAAVHFALAGTLTQVICEAVNAQDNRTQEALRLPPLEVSTRYNYTIPPYNEIISECKSGASAYKAFGLESVYDIGTITNLADRFKRKAKHLANQVSLPNDATENIVFLSPTAKEQLARFADSKIKKIKFDTFADQLEESIVSVDLRDVINRFNATVQDADDFDPDTRIELLNEILILESLDEKILVPMLQDVKRAAESLRFLSNQQKDLSGRIDAVTDAAAKAEESLRSTGAKQQVRQLAHEFEQEFLKHVENYANFSYKSIKEQVGSCGPLYNSLNATTTTFCHKIGSPLSAFWLSLTFLLLLFIPLLIVGMILSRLYKKYKYLGYESETYYSTYGDGDTIPLSIANGGGGGGGRRMKRGARDSAASAASAAALSSSATSGGNQHSRYQNRFEDTSQNLDSLLEGAARRPSSSSPLHHPHHARPTNLRFIDTPSSHEVFVGGFDGGGAGDNIDNLLPPPPSYSIAVRYSKMRDDEIVYEQETQLSSTSTESFQELQAEDDEGDLPGAWGSQAAFNNRHTPPTTSGGEYERPPPYYYPGPAAN